MQQVLRESRERTAPPEHRDAWEESPTGRSRQYELYRELRERQGLRVAERTAAQEHREPQDAGQTEARERRVPQDAEQTEAQERRELQDAGAWVHRELQGAGAWVRPGGVLPEEQDEEPPGERGAEPWEVREVCS